MGNTAGWRKRCDSGEKGGEKEQKWATAGLFAWVTAQKIKGGEIC